MSANEKKMPSLIRGGSDASAFWTTEQAVAYYARAFPDFPLMQQGRVKNRDKLQKKAEKLADELIQKYGEPNSKYKLLNGKTKKIESRDQLVSAIFRKLMHKQCHDEYYEQAKELRRRTYQAIEKVDAAIAELERKSRRAYKNVSADDFKPLADDETEK